MGRSRPSRYDKAMTTLTYSSGRRKALEAAFLQVLTPSQRTMVRELVRAESRAKEEPQPEQLLYWLRLNMPGASSRIEHVLHPYDA